MCSQPKKIPNPRCLYPINLMQEIKIKWWNLKEINTKSFKNKVVAEANWMSKSLFRMVALH